jgi:hypothetical protein
MNALATAAAPRPDAIHDFDFLFGRWRIANRRLRRRLEGCTEWDEFEATSECRPVLGGQGNLETYETAWQEGFRGLALRLFEPAAQQWSIHWAGNRSGVLEPAVRGGFEHGVGNFYGPDSHAGRTVLARYRWSAIRGEYATWDQAWSLDAGAHWETNWVMQFRRTGA